ncbi:hypothetical protein PMAYCL1PPCAC_12978, partial [Pristionchus mayeri]
RLSWLALAFAIIAVSLDDTLATTDSTSTLPADSTTPQATADDVTTTTGQPDNSDTAAPATDGSTDEPVGPVTTGPQPTGGSSDEPVVPVTRGPEPTEDGSTGETKPAEKTTAKVVTTEKTTVKAGTTTTKEPEPDVESFSVHCDKVTEMCTYTMQVPGLDVDTFTDLITKTNNTEEDVSNFESTDLVNLQVGVTKVYNDAEVTVDYVQSQLDDITAEVKNLETQASALEDAINQLNVAVTNANNSLNKILAKKGSCLYRQCVLKETTTPKPTTTTTVRTTPTPFCKRSENEDICQNEGQCINYYDSYYCECKGNLDGQDYNCNTSACDIFNQPQEPGLIYSPGYNGTNFAVDDCDAAQWKIKAVNSTTSVLTLVGTSFTDNISKLTSESNLQLTVGKYKLKITSKTKIGQISQILENGASATINYSGPATDYFHFEITEKVGPTPSPTPAQAP